MSESDFFLKQMNGVKPIKKNNKIEKEKSDIKNKIIQKKNKPIKKKHNNQRYRGCSKKF